MNLEIAKHNSVYGNHQVKENTFTTLIDSCYNEFTESGKFPRKRLLKCAIEELYGYINHSHEIYLERALPQLSLSIANLSKSRSLDPGTVLILNHFYLKYYDHLTTHIQEEEDHLLSSIEYLINLSKGSVRRTMQIESDIKDIFECFLHDHTDTNIEIIQLQNFIDTLKKGNETPFELSQFESQLQLFKQDLQFHSLVEEDVLLPKAIGLFKELVTE